MFAVRAIFKREDGESPSQQPLPYLTAFAEKEHIMPLAFAEKAFFLGLRSRHKSGNLLHSWKHIVLCSWVVENMAFDLWGSSLDFHFIKPLSSRLTSRIKFQKEKRREKNEKKRKRKEKGFYLDCFICCGFIVDFLINFRDWGRFDDGRTVYNRHFTNRGV